MVEKAKRERKQLQQRQRQYVETVPAVVEATQGEC